MFLCLFQGFSMHPVVGRLAARHRREPLGEQERGPEAPDGPGALLARGAPEFRQQLLLERPAAGES